MQCILSLTEILVSQIEKADGECTPCIRYGRVNIPAKLDALCKIYWGCDMSTFFQGPSV